MSKIITVNEADKTNYLKRISEDTTIEEVRALKLAEQIQQALKNVWTEGCGLAACQIGAMKRYAWYQLPGQEPKELLNPVITKAKYGSYYEKGEGCLSIPKKRFRTYRFNFIEFLNFDQSEEGRLVQVDGFEAIVVQHEVDHMQGLLCSDIRGPIVVGRNEPCSCGSGSKFKKCCG